MRKIIQSKSHCNNSALDNFELPEVKQEIDVDDYELSSSTLVVAQVKGSDAKIDLKKSEEGKIKAVRLFECDYCGKKFKSKGHIIDHIQIHSTYCNHQCKVCKKKFYVKRNLIRHQMLVHSKSEIPFACFRCGKSFKNDRYLATHCKYMHGTAGRPFLCNICNCAFKLKHHLSRHQQRIHQQ